MGTPLNTEVGHQWVAFSMTPVELVGTGTDGDPVFVDAIDGCSGHTVYGCQRCDASANSPEAIEKCVPNGNNE